MSEHVAGTNREQTVLFPDTIDQYVDKENPVRFIDAFSQLFRDSAVFLR